MIPAQSPVLRTGEVISSEEATAARKAQRRLVGTLAAASIVVLAISFLLNAWLEKDREGMDVRSSLSVKGDGYRASRDVLEKLGFRAIRHRKSYGQLPPPDRSVLMIVDPLPDAVLEGVEQTVVDASQIRELETWIKRGGRLIAAPSGRMAIQAFGFSARSMESEQRRTPLAGALLGTDLVHRLLEKRWPEFERGQPWGPVKGEGELENFAGTWRPLPEGMEQLVSPFLTRRGARPLTDIQAVVAMLEEEGTGPLEMDLFAGDVREEWLPVARVGGKVVVAATSLGEGKVYLFSSAYPFTNAAFAAGGTAPLVLAVLNEATDRGERVVAFDEYSHGLWARKGFLGWVFSTTLFYPVVTILIGAFVLLWQGAVRPGPAREERSIPRRAKEEFVVSLADILLRARRFKAARDSLIDAFESRQGSWAHRIASLKADSAHLASFGSADLERFAIALDEIKRRIRLESAAQNPRTPKSTT